MVQGSPVESSVNCEGDKNREGILCGREDAVAAVSSGTGSPAAFLGYLRECWSLSDPRFPHS